MTDGKSSSNNGDEVAQHIREQLKALQRQYKSQVFRSIDLLHAQIVQNLRSGLLARRTGNLMNSMKKEVIQEGESTWTGKITSTAPYALIHEFGGTIKPVKAKALLIPSEQNRNKDGSPKITAQELRNGLGQHSFVKWGVIWLQTKAGRGKGSTKLTPMFYLQKSVTIPARPYIRPALAAKRDQIMKDFGVFISLAFKGKD